MKTNQQKLNEQISGYRSNELEDGDKIIVKCSNCDTELIELWITRPNVPVKSFISANCDACGDSSFEVEVEGMFNLGEIEDSPVRMVDMKTDVETVDNKMIQRLTIITEVMNNE